MEYEVFHDESTPEEEGYWHGILFVPVKYKPILVKQLATIREFYEYPLDTRLSFGSVNREGGKKFNAVNASLALFNKAVQSQVNAMSDTTGVYGRRRGVDDEQKLIEIIKVPKNTGVRLQLLREKNSHKEMVGFYDHAAKIETTFRFALKSGMHFFFDKSTPIHLRGAYFDGHEHLKRHIDPSRVLKNMDKDLRSYCSIDGGFKIDDRQGKHRKDETILIMDFIDNVIGAWRCLIMGSPANKAQEQITMPIEALWDRWQQGLIIKNPRTRWYKSICLSECFLINGEWKFRPKFGIKDDKQQRLL